MQQPNVNDLGNGKISRIFWYYTLPSVFMLIVQNAAYFIDSIYIGQYVGAVGLSALTLIMPVIIFLAGFGMMIAIGGTTLAGIEKGAGNKESSNNLFNVTLHLLLYSGIIGGLLLYFSTPFLARILGVSGQTLQYTIDYAQYTSYFVPFFLLHFAFGFFLKLDEKPMVVMIGMFAGALVNVFLDYLFVGRMGMEMSGAAIATGASQVVPVVFFLFVIIRSSNWRLAKPIFHFFQIKRIFFNGLSELLTNIAMALTGAFFNIIILRQVGEYGVAAFTVAMQIMEFVRAIGYGVGEGNQAAFSYNFGAHQLDRVASLRNLALKVSAVIGVVLTIGSLLFSREVAQLFVTEAHVLDMSVEILFYCAISFVFTGINIVIATYYTSINDPIRSAGITIYRSLLAPLAGLVFLPLLLGEEGIWMTFLFIELTSFVIGCVLLKKLPFGDKNLGWKTH